VDHRVIRQNGHNASTNTHTSSEFLVAHNAVPLVSYGDVPVAPTLSALNIIAQMQPCSNGDTLSLSQTSNNPCLIYQTVC
jgi:hypothetical protein